MGYGFFLSAILLSALPVHAQSAPHSGIHPEDMDATCKPCTDFWRYVNGGWVDKNPIPADKRSWGSFEILRSANRERIRTLLDTAEGDRSAIAGSDRRKMGDLYTSCMDGAAIEAHGLRPVQSDFDRIAAIKTVDELGAVLSFLQRQGRPAGNQNGAVAGGFRLGAMPDPKQPRRIVARISERDSPGRAGSAILSLPDREYYFKDDERSKTIRSEFLVHVAKILVLSGTAQETAKEQAAGILKFETALAEAVLTIAAKRDPNGTYHLMDLSGLRELAPDFNWARLLREAGLPESTPVNVTEPELLKRFNRQLTAVPLGEWKVWLRWRTLQLMAPYLTRAVADEAYRFESGVLAGVQQQPPRWEACANVIDRDLSDVLGKAYVEKYFPAEAKRRMGELVENLRAAMREELEQSEWMSAATKKCALAKLAALKVKIGYADAWHSYTPVQIDRAKYFDNVRSAWANRFNTLMRRVGNAPDPNDWGMTPPTVNASANSSLLELVFPAGILQPPFFDMQAEDAANYGAIGAVIGHEIGHQFDDQGSKFDQTGTLKNWWTADDRAKFEQRASCVADQFNTLDVGDGLHHNGRQVLGEALGDLGGIAVAYRAYKKSLAGKPEPAAMDGFTADQRFFLAFGRIWGTVQRPDAMRLQINTDNHPLGRWRAIGTLQNFAPFHKAFQCKPGDAMVRPAAEQCKIW